MSKQANPIKQILSPAEMISKAEHTIAALEQKREHLNNTLRQHASARERLSFQAHAMHDAEASKELADAREAALRAEQEQTEVESALVTARFKLNEAQRAQDRDQRRELIKQQRERSKQFRELGPYLDKAVDNLRRGAIALGENASVVGRDWRHVATLYRVLSIALAGTPFREMLPVPDSNDKRTFSTFSAVLNGWCDSHEASLRHELQALDGEQQTNEAA